MIGPYGVANIPPIATPSGFILGISWQFGHNRSSLATNQPL
jgi:hypothetical protein